MVLHAYLFGVFTRGFVFIYMYLRYITYITENSIKLDYPYSHTEPNPASPDTPATALVRVPLPNAHYNPLHQQSYEYVPSTKQTPPTKPQPHP